MNTKIIKMFDRNVEEFNIFFPQSIMENITDLNNMEKNEKIEYQYYLLCDAERCDDFNYYVVDLWVPYQISSASLTEEDLDKDISRMIEQMEALTGYKLIKCHSHHNMSAFSSSTDIQEAKKSLLLQMVHNHDGDYVVYNENGRCKCNLHLTKEEVRTTRYDVCIVNIDERLGRKPVPKRTISYGKYQTPVHVEPIETREDVITYDDLLFGDDEHIELPCLGGVWYDPSLCINCPESESCLL